MYGAVNTLLLTLFSILLFFSLSLPLAFFPVLPPRSNRAPVPVALAFCEGDRRIQDLALRFSPCFQINPPLKSQIESL
jgi:hypothetical protein